MDRILKKGGKKIIYRDGITKTQSKESKQQLKENKR
jgi:hypothetical protein